MRLVPMLLGLVLVLGAAAAIASGVSASPAGADPLTDCTTTTGAIVVVDFAFWGGNIQRGCAASPTTGYAAMLSAGFAPAGDQHDGDAFVCRIDDDPPASKEDCVDTPPPTASWSYWHAKQGASTWTYSSTGAMDYCPPPGSVDAWVFVGTPGTGSNGYPPFPPSAVLATTPGPVAADPCASSSPSNAGPGAGGSASPSVGGASTPGSTQPTTQPTTQPMTQPATAPTTATPPASPSVTSPVVTTAPKPSGRGSHGPAPHVNARPSASEPKIVDVVPASIDHRPMPGSPLALVIGGSIAALLAGGGGLVAWRRRQEQLDRR